MADQKAAELATATANAERDRALIAKQESELKELNPPMLKKLSAGWLSH